MQAFVTLLHIAHKECVKYYHSQFFSLHENTLSGTFKATLHLLNPGIITYLLLQREHD